MPKINRKQPKLPWKASLPKKKGSWGYDTGFYSNKVWRNTRQAKLFDSPLCEECLRKGLTVSGSVVDHIKPRRERPDLELEWSNLQTLCETCHNSKSGREGRGGQNPQKGCSTNR